MTVAGQQAIADAAAAKAAAIASGAGGYYDRGQFISLGPSTQEKLLAAAVQTGQGFGSLGGTTVESRTAYARSLGFSPTEVRTARGELPFGSRRAEKQQVTEEVLKLQRQGRPPVSEQQKRYASLIQSINERERGQAPRGALTAIGQQYPQGAGFSVFKIPARTNDVQETFSPAFARKAAQAEAQGDSLVLSNAFGLKVAGTQEFRTPEQRAQDNKAFLQRQIERTASFQKPPVKQLGGFTRGNAEITKPVYVGAPAKDLYIPELQGTKTPILTPLQKTQQKLFGKIPLNPFTSEGITPSQVTKVFGKGTLNLISVGGLGQTFPFAAGKGSEEILKKPETKATAAAVGVAGLEVINFFGRTPVKYFTFPAQAALYGTTVRNIELSVRGEDVLSVQKEAQAALNAKQGVVKRSVSNFVSTVAIDPFSNQASQFEEEAYKIGIDKGYSPEKARSIAKQAGLARGELAGAEFLGQVVFAERGSELVGRESIATSFGKFSKENVKKLFTKEEALKLIKKRTSSKFILAGISEAESQLFLNKNIKGEKVSPREVAVAGVSGAFLGKFFGVPVSQSAIRPVRGGIYNTAGRLLEFPQEDIGDILTNVFQKEVSVLTKKPTVSAAIIKKGVQSGERFSLTTIREGVQGIKARVRVSNVANILSSFNPFGGGGTGGGGSTPINSDFFNIGVSTRTTSPINIKEPVSSRTLIDFKKFISVKEPVTIKQPVTIKEPITIKQTVSIKTPVTIKEPVTIKQPINIKEPITIKEPVSIKTPINVVVPIPRFPAFFPPLPLGGEFSFNRESIGRGRKGQYQASFFGVALGKRVKSVPLGASFSGFEIRGIPGGTSKSFKQPKPFTADVNKDLFSKGLGKLDINLAGKSFGSQKKGDDRFGGLLNVGFGKRSSKKKSNKLFRRNLGKGFRL